MVKKKQHGGKRPGSGRPVGEDGPTVIVTVTVPEGLVDDLMGLAESQGWNKSKAVTEAIRELLKRKKR